MKSGATQLRDWMKRRAFNQTEAAAYLGLDGAVVSKILNGRITPGLDNALMIERKTGIPVEAWSSIDGDDSAEPIAADAHSTQD